MFKYIGRAVDKLLGGFEQILPKKDPVRAKIEIWDNIYKGKPNWLSDKVKTMGLGASIASELARLTTLEMKSEIVGQESLDKIYQEEVVDRLRENIEYAAALGGIVLKPYINSRDQLKIEFISALDFIPLDEDLLSGMFIDRRQVDNRTLVRIETHKLNTDGTYVIENKAYESYDAISGRPVPLSILPEWEHLEELVTITDIEKPLFAYYRIPNANTINQKSPLGVSVYSKAEHLMEEADKQYSRILWEYEGSELRVHVDINMLDRENNLSNLYVTLDSGEDGFYEVYSPDIRDESFYNGLNKLLQRIEFSCGLAYGTLSDVQMVDKTATEIKASKQRSFSTVRDMQKSLEKTLIDLVDIMIVYDQLYNLGLSSDTEPEISFEFDDSIVVDSETEQTILLQEVSAGIISKEEYLKRRYGITEEQAKDMMPKDYLEVDDDANTGVFARNIRDTNREGSEDRRSDDRKDS